ncbi:MAG TPA: hypothetical protein VGG39_03565 [Polyangiaceae bacterium]|jgi:hypothetical protein
MRLFVPATPGLAALAALGAVALAVGCSSASSPGGAAASGDDGGGGASSGGGTGSSGGSAGDGGGGLPYDAGNLTTVSFQMETNVPGGGEEFECKYVQLPDAKEWMVQAQHDYTPGSHHLLLYTTALTSIPPGGDQMQDCYEGTGNKIMNDATGVLYGAQTPTGGETMPTGVGLPAVPNEVLIFQVHYLNAGATALDAKVNVDLTFDTDGDDIQQQAGIIFFYDPFIDVPAGSTAKASMRCPIPSDITLLYASSHYHSRGVGYSAWNDSAPDQLATSSFYTSDSWSSPDNAQLTMPIKGGSLIRFECDYDNSAGTQDYFAGQSAQTNEMCMFIGTYYPEMGQLADFCFNDPDMFGTGTATCSASLTCLQNCGSQVGGIDGLQASPPDCEQTCFADSCPSASGPLISFVTCLQNSCESQCSDPTSAGCTSCITTNCATQYEGCQSQTCP